MSTTDEIKQELLDAVIDMDSREVDFLLGFLKDLIEGKDTEKWWQLAREVK